MRRRLPLIFLLSGIGCSDPDPAPRNGPASAEDINRPSVSVSYRDSILDSYRLSAESVLVLMHPDHRPQDVRVSAALLESTAGEGKIRFVRYLASQGERSVPPVLEVIDRSSDRNTLVSALQILGQIGSSEATGAIKEMLENRDSWVRIAAAHAIGDVGGETAVQALEQTIEDSVDTVVAAGLVALGKLGDTKGIKLCGRKVIHANPRVRAAAATAIGRLGTFEQTSLLTPLLKDPDSGVRFKAKRAIEYLRKDAGY